MNYELIKVGLITKAHGVRGEVAVKPLTDDPNRFEQLKRVVVIDSDDREASLNREAPLDKEAYEIEYLRRHKDRLLLKFKGLDNINEVNGLKGKYLAIEEKDLIKLPKDSYFIFDLLGCEVFNLDDALLGVVSDVLQTSGANDVYVVEPVVDCCPMRGEQSNVSSVQDKHLSVGKSRDILIPAVKSVIKSVSIKDKRIVVDFEPESG